MAIISGRISKEETMIPYQKEKIENAICFFATEQTFMRALTGPA
jgi:hypothetical protein